MKELPTRKHFANFIPREDETTTPDKNAVVIGGAGYIGSTLTPLLIANGYRTTIVDNGLASTFQPYGDRVRYVPGDVRDCADWAHVLEGADAVINLAAIVGDPACDLSHDLAWEVNYLGVVRLAEECKKHGAARLVFASTCSNYGVSHEGSADVRSALQPQSVYALTKIHAEHHLLASQDRNFFPCILRFATIYGIAPRMRFDLAINVMTAMAAAHKRVTVFNGDQWRPFLHVYDAARAIVLACETSRHEARAEIYNCGTTEENYTMNDIGKLIVEEIPGAVLAVESSGDARNYRVCFDQIRTNLGFTSRYRVRDGIREIRDAIYAGRYRDFTDARYSDYHMTRNALNAPNTRIVHEGQNRWPQLVFNGGHQK